MARTFIIGNSGAGKSTLAKRLSTERRCLHLDLDRFAWTDVVGVRRPLVDSVSAAEGELGAREAVIEGCYADLVQALARPVDHLIFLDIPVEQCVAHCRARPYEPHKWPSAEQQDAFLPQLLDFVREYPSRTDTLGWPAHDALFRSFVGTKQRITTDD